jgi:hypothetical protein
MRQPSLLGEGCWLCHIGSSSQRQDVEPLGCSQMYFRPSASGLTAWCALAGQKVPPLTGALVGAVVALALRGEAVVCAVWLAALRAAAAGLDGTTWDVMAGAVPGWSGSVGLPPDEPEHAASAMPAATARLAAPSARLTRTPTRR